jgi:phosphate transport system substrate-binding protein
MALKTSALAVPAVVAGLVLQGQPAAAQATIAADGSSTVVPVTEVVAEEFRKANRGVRVTAGSSGTGGGFRKFCRGETTIQNASRPILRAEMEECRRAGVRYLELPAAFDVSTVVASPRNSFAQCLTVQELRQVWEPGAQGQVTSWRRGRDGSPDARLTLYGAASDSGAFDYLTEADAPKTVAIDGGQGCAQPPQEAVLNGTCSPLSRPLFYLSCQDQELVRYLPLPQEAYDVGMRRLSAPRAGA